MKNSNYRLTTEAILPTAVVVFSTSCHKTSERAITAYWNRMNRALDEAYKAQDAAVVTETAVVAAITTGRLAVSDTTEATWTAPTTGPTKGFEEFRCNACGKGTCRAWNSGRTMCRGCEKAATRAQLAIIARRGR